MTTLSSNFHWNIFMTAASAIAWMRMNKPPSAFTTICAALPRVLIPALLLLGLMAESARAESLLLSNGIVHTVSGATLTPGSVLIKDDKIQAVGAQLSAPGVKVIDLKGQHLYPGLLALN